MLQAEHEFTRITSSQGIARCLEGLTQHKGAALLVDKPSAAPAPVLLVSADPGERLVIDVSAVRDVLLDLKMGTGFRLMGQRAGKLERSPVLMMESFWEEEGALYIAAPYPEYFEVLLRRHSFRAEMRLGLRCEVLVKGGERHGVWDGELRNLSMTGCLVELPLGAATMLAADDIPLFGLELCFPNGTRFNIRARLSHQMSNLDQRYVRAGFEFEAPDVRQDRELWYFVREIEREGARSGMSDGEGMPSALFTPVPSAEVNAPRKKGEDYPTSMARNLSFIAEFLDTQILALRSGENINSVQLSRHAERLLSMQEQAREDLLFAAVCMSHEAPVVRHCLGVAIRLGDMAGKSMPRELRKSLMAAAMVHDLGKVLLPSDLIMRGKLDDDDKLLIHGHVNRLYERMEDCRWLASEVSDPVLLQINERLDGSGYPNGLSGDSLHQLARLAAVVDAVDAMGRVRPGRPAHPINVIYTYLQSIPMHFDPRWVKNYIRHFGVLPVGTLLRYPGDVLAWVRKVDQKGLPALVQIALEEGAPRVGTLGDKLEGAALEELGKPEAILPSES